MNIYSFIFILIFCNLIMAIPYDTNENRAKYPKVELLPA